MSSMVRLRVLKSGVALGECIPLTLWSPISIIQALDLQYGPLIWNLCIRIPNLGGHSTNPTRIRKEPITRAYRKTLEIQQSIGCGIFIALGL